MDKIYGIGVLIVTIIWIIICVIAHFFDPGLQKLCDDLGKILLALVGAGVAVYFVRAARGDLGR